MTLSAKQKKSDATLKIELLEHEKDQHYTDLMAVVTACEKVGLAAPLAVVNDVREYELKLHGAMLTHEPHGGEIHFDSSLTPFFRAGSKGVPQLVGYDLDLSKVPKQYDTVRIYIAAF